MAADGTFWVSDAGRNDVPHFDAQGGYLGQIGSRGTGPGQFQLT